MARPAPARRAAQRRLPHPVPRHRRRRGRPARVPVRRRPAPRRLERHRPHRRARTCGSTWRTARSRRGWCSTPRRRWRSGRRQRRKHRVLTEVAATIAQLLSRGGSRVGAVLFDGAVREMIPPGQGRNQVLRIIDRLLRAVPDDEPVERPGTTDLAGALRAAHGVARRRSLVVLDQRLHRARAGLAGAAGPAGPPARRGGRAGRRPARVRAARRRDDLRGGRRDRRGDLRRHRRPGVPAPPAHRCRRAAVGAGGRPARGRPGAAHRRDRRRPGAGAVPDRPATRPAAAAR